MSSEQNHELALESDPFYRNWRELIMPERVEVDKDSLTDNYGKFVIQPLERGFATTIGNSFRRLIKNVKFRSEGCCSR